MMRMVVGTEHGYDATWLEMVVLGELKACLLLYCYLSVGVGGLKGEKRRRFAT